LKIKQGVELEVELDDGRLMLIVQEKDDVYAVGDRIRVVEAQDGTLRVRQ
jgi:outer membrane lipoprotein SlyB